LPPDDAKQLLRKLRELFPDATPAQSSLLERHFESCNKEAAEKALEDYAQRNERLIPSRLIEMLKDHCPPPADWRESARAQRAERNREDRDIEKVISTMSDEEISRCVCGIEKAQPDAFRFLKGKDPRKSEWLRHLIYQHVRAKSSGKPSDR
jgi:hypothetical protein